VASKDPFLPPPPPLVREPAPDGSERVRGGIAERGGPALLAVRRPPGLTVAWTEDHLGPSPGVVEQSLSWQAPVAPRRLAVVVDGSAAMRGSATALAAALVRLPGSTRVAILVAADQPADLTGGLVGTGDAAFRAALDRLAHLDFTGGNDNLPALERAWDLAAGDGAGTGRVLWIHGPQPVLLGSVAPLRQRAERTPDGPTLISCAAVAGPDRLLPALAPALAVEVVARQGTLADDLRALVESWARPTLRLERERRATASPPGWHTSDHLARLWARDRIDMLLRTRAHEQALELAASYRLVTPVSGAVVLENKQQYDDAGLQPGHGSSVPTVPEPALWAELALVLLVLGLVARRGRLRAA
jgi:hypothetical protein